MEYIKKEHILSAIQEIKENPSLRKGRASTMYDLIYDGKDYPPKLVISIANKFATGKELDHKTFYGGPNKPAFDLLAKEGFEVIPKKDPITSLIADYKKHIASTQLKDEAYKWDLVKEYNGRPNPDAADFLQELKSIKFSNLIYAMGYAVIIHLAKAKPNELREVFKVLFDETKGLADRVQYFNSETLKIYRDLGETLQHHQDERSISTYLTYHDSTKYTFYKSSVYKNLCKILGIKEAGKNEKYVHFLQLIKDIIENHIKPDYELINQVKELLPNSYDGENHMILAQDILYKMLEKEKEVNYWIFQGSPKIYNAIDAINANAVTTWTVSAHKDKIKPGDKFILWLTGANPGCYALGRVDSEVMMMKEENHEMNYYVKPTDQVEKERVKVVIEHSFVDAPILLDMVKNEEPLLDFNGGNQGTNFTATKEQYDTFLEYSAANTSNAYEEIKSSLDREKVNKYLEFLRAFLRANNIAENDERISFNIRKSKKRLVFIIGNRYSFLIEKKNAATEFCFISKEILPQNTTEFFNQKKEVEAHWNTVENIENFEEYIRGGLLTELSRSNKCPFRKYSNHNFIDDIYQDQRHMDNTADNSQSPINQILYGPPGTGKTYTLKTDYFPKYTLRETSVTKELFFEETVRMLTWWQVLALALLEDGTSRVNDILNNRWVAVKAALSESKNVRATLWGTLQMHTIQESKTVAYTQRQTPLIFDKKEDKSWVIFETELKDQAPELYEILDSVNNFNANPQKEIKHYVFTTFHQSFSYEDFIEGIKPKMEEENESNDLSYKIEPGIFKELCSRAQNDPNNRYAIFIDEINRGNVSQIFGELITLIETDKRIGAAHEMKVKLPYSKKEFGVPMNVDIYGTMNTADRSVEALDTALRRRFSFKELMPNTEIVAQNKFTDYARVAIMEKINNRIELLLDRNHTLGHAYFIKPDFKNSFENEIIPLLQEYFFNDYGKIGLVLGQGFVREKSISAIKDKSVFADFETKNEVDIIKSYELIPFHTIDFEAAIQTLLA